MEESVPILNPKECFPTSGGTRFMVVEEQATESRPSVGCSILQRHAAQNKTHTPRVLERSEWVCLNGGPANLALCLLFAFNIPKNGCRPNKTHPNASDSHFSASNPPGAEEWAGTARSCRSQGSPLSRKMKGIPVWVGGGAFWDPLTTNGPGKSL